MINLDNSLAPKINAGLFLFYLALLGGYTAELLSPDLVKFLGKNRIAQHLISFLMLLFTVNLYTPNIKFINIFKYSFILWIWYLLTSKQHLTASIIIIILLTLSYVAFNLADDLDNDKYKELDAKERARLKKKYRSFQTICFFSVIIVSLIGGYQYFIEHYKQYGKDDKNFLDFLFKYLFMGSGKKAGK